MVTQTLGSWGRTSWARQEVMAPSSRHAPFAADPGNRTFLPYGNGRSYGDSCLNEGGVAVKTRGLDRFIAFDPATGLLACESGMLLADILRLTVPRGWFLPVTPGTRFVTVGGAIANDVHGKNHHVAGTFGRHVARFELLRSDGRRLLCSPEENPGHFAAAIGGLGLTGLITWAELRLRPIANPWLRVETRRFESLDGFFDLSAASDRDFEYTVAWIDCASQGASIGRGLFMRANHAGPGEQRAGAAQGEKTFPFTPPFSLVNPATLKMFNAFYYHRSVPEQALQHYEPFFYPLDGIREWNRLYGPRGFRQYQCVVPAANGRPALADMLAAIAREGGGSFLSVLKVCGDAVSPGILSFPLPGVSLALDFPETGESLERLLQRLDRIVTAAGGRLYPAKDGRMPGSIFRAGYPRWNEFAAYIDPRFSSSFWRRVMNDTHTSPRGAT